MYQPQTTPGSARRSTSAGGSHSRRGAGSAGVAGDAREARAWDWDADPFLSFSATRQIAALGGCPPQPRFRGVPAPSTRSFSGLSEAPFLSSAGIPTCRRISDEQGSPVAADLGRQDRILLQDVKALTLHHDRYTTSRRLGPVPQLKCVGGTAGCDSYTPKVVQCQNKGWDGYDVQWECKTDLDIAYKFGKTVVSCEGYESSEDQYVLRGSCGLEYNLDYTEHGLKKLRESGKNPGSNTFSDYYKKLYTSDSGGISGLITIVVLLAVAFGVYKLFLSDGQDSPPPYSEYPPNSHHYQGFTTAAGPPPPGFKPGFTGPYGATSGFGSAFTGQQGHENSGPGFWTGLGTGGILGYLFGSNRAATPFSDSWYRPSHHPSYSGTWGSQAYSPFRGGSGSSSACSSSETKTRTASGYGGTRRR